MLHYLSSFQREFVYELYKLMVETTNALLRSLGKQNTLDSDYKRRT